MALAETEVIIFPVAAYLNPTNQYNLGQFTATTFMEWNWFIFRRCDVDFWCGSPSEIVKLGKHYVKFRSDGHDTIKIGLVRPILDYPNN